MKYFLKKTSFSLLIFLISGQSWTQTPVQGYVFEDTNQNGKKERKEPGIPDIAVTNGKEVVLTNNKGKYALPVDEDDIISIIKPSDYKVHVNEDNLPQFYYIHKPQGSPNLKFEGVSPTGRLPESVDFGLTPSEEDENFSSFIFGDPQSYTQEEVDFFARGIISDLKGIDDISFGLSLGDLVGNDLDLFNPYIQAVKEAGIPWYNLLGNHDLNFDADTDELADETFEAHFGPANYAFNYGRVHFIVLDDVLYPDPRDGKGYWGGFREDQLQFVENDLKHVPMDYLVVLAFHIPLSSSFRNEDREKLFKLLKDFPHTLSLSAHTHIQRQDFFGKEEGWHQEKPHHHYNVGTTSGDWYSGELDENGVPISTMRDGTPRGYALLNFEGNDYTIDYKVAGKPKDYRMEIFVPKVVANGKKTQAGIFVNFFIGTEKDTLMCRIDDGDWKQMEHIEEPDPSYIDYVYEWDHAEELMPGRRRPSSPKISTHLWRGNIPAHLETGDHKIEVKAIDMFGRTLKKTSSFRLEEPK